MPYARAASVLQAVRAPALWSRVSLARAGLPASFHDFLQHRQVCPHRGGPASVPF